MDIKQRRIGLKKPMTRKQVPKRFSSKGGIKIYRSGLKGEEWNLVDDDPVVVQQDRSISISANITPNKTSKKQSVLYVEISEDALIALFETLLGIRNMSVGRLMAEIKMLRESSKSDQV